MQSLAATLAERYEREGTLPIQPRPLIEENKWRAARFGLDADLVDLERDEERPAPDALRALAELAAPAAKRLGCAEELELLEACSSAATARTSSGRPTPRTTATCSASRSGWPHKRSN